jgi:hypothetical protein
MEQQILRLLQQVPDTLFSAKEVGKNLDRKQYRENPNWARPFLETLLRQKLIAADTSGYYFFPKRKKLGEIR